MKVRELGEFNLIDRIASITGQERDRVVLGIGDDASVLSSRQGYNLVTTTDMLIQGVHFLWERIPPRDLGYKSLAVNISDLAAMGALPIQAFVSIGLPGDTDVSDVDSFYEGIMESAAGNLQISGGDTVSSPSGWAISVTALGEVREGRELRRDTASPGEIIYLSGPVGDSAAGLSLILEGGHSIDRESAEFLIRAHNRPVPQVKLGLTLSERALSCCAIDISDGLLQDLGHICRASGVGADIHMDRIPLSPQMVEVSKAAGTDLYLWPLTGGEDYSLLFTVMADRKDQIQGILDDTGLAAVPIGEITEGDEVSLYLNGKRRPLPGKGGFNHFQKA